MPALQPMSVEIDTELPILKLRDVNGYEMRYWLGEDGQLTLGKVWQLVNKDYKVILFLPAGQDIPILLKVTPHTDA